LSYGNGRRRQGYRLFRPGYGHGRCRKHAGDASFRVPFLRAQQQPVGCHLAGHVFLGQRRALVGQGFLIADDRDGAGGIERAHLCREGCCGLPRANDDYVQRHPILLRESRADVDTGRLPFN
jgi:hypothetical protein